MSKDELISIGKIVGAHGIKGEVTLLPYGPLVEGFNWNELSLKRKEGQRPCDITGVRPHKGGYLLTIAGYTTRNAAESLIGIEVSIKKSALPKLQEDEFYTFELIGAEAVTDDGRSLGHVTGIIVTGSNDVLEVNGADGEILIPMIEQVIIKTDIANRQITVHLMEGIELTGKKK